MNSSSEPVPDEEYDALLTIVHGAVVTSGGVSLQRTLMTDAGARRVLGIDSRDRLVARELVGRYRNALPGIRPW